MSRGGGVTDVNSLITSRMQAARMLRAEGELSPTTTIVTVLCDPGSRLERGEGKRGVG